MEDNSAVVTVKVVGDKLTISTEFNPVFDENNPAHIAGALMALRYARGEGAEESDISIVPRGT